MSLIRKIKFVLAVPFIFIWILALLVRYGLPDEPPDYELDCGWWG